VEGLRIALGVLLGLVSLWLIFNGAMIVFQTMGTVRGSEFSILITMTNIIASMAVWMGIFALWKIIPVERTTGDDVDA